MQNIKVKLVRYLSLLIVSVVPFQNATAETVLYCQSELATGFSSINGSYKAMEFTPKRYTVKVLGDFSEVILGKSIYDCRPSISNSRMPHLVTCFHTAWIREDGKRLELGGLPKLFYYDRKTQRFLFADLRTTGYSENGPDTENLYAGKCETF